MVKEAKRFEVWLITLDPRVGGKIKKTRPCVIISPDDMSKLNTVLIAPLTSKGLKMPMRLSVKFQGKSGLILLDQIRSVDKIRLVKKMGDLDAAKSKKLCKLLQEMFSF